MSVRRASASLGCVPEEERGTQTGAYLKLLLVRPGKVRSSWEKFALVRPWTTGIDYQAVATVLGEADVPALRAALDGGRMSTETIDRFVSAFDLGTRHADRLRSLWRGSQSVRMIDRPALAPVASRPTVPRHQTVAVHEIHTLGPDGVPAEHQTIQVIRSTVDNLTACPYRFDTDQMAVDVIHGGRVGDPYRVADRLYGVDIVLDRPLPAGATMPLHYRTIFLYTTPPVTEFRRGLRCTMREATLWLQFHPDRLPAHVFWARWDRVAGGNIVEQREVDLDGDCSVQVRYQAPDEKIPDGLVGFHWEF
jgi:hypothetical protein